LVHKLTHEDAQFSLQVVLVVLRILNTRVLDFFVVSGLISLSAGLFLWFLICGVVQVSFLSLAVDF
jgi:hypothetical protein